MAVNRDKPDNWKADVAASVDFYNDWFLKFAPVSYRDTRIETTKSVETTLALTSNLTDIKPEVLAANPSVLPTLRASTAPPIARDRLIGLAGVIPGLVYTMENELRIPPKLAKATAYAQLERIGEMIRRLADPDIFTWLETRRTPTEIEVHRAATIVADRLCGAVADPIIRNAQERRQLAYIREWLEARGYSLVPSGQGLRFDQMKPGNFAFRLNIPVVLAEETKSVNIPVDVAVQPSNSTPGSLPLLIEAKSAGDFTNTNKRRKEEAVKVTQLRANYGEEVRFILFLCGYFDSGYLGYEAAERIDWVWEHRIDDLTQFGV